MKGIARKETATDEIRISTVDTPGREHLDRWGRR
jgi:hypothetical protein